MRGGDDIVSAEQRVLERWLIDEDVDCGARNMTGVERGSEVILDDETAASATFASARRGALSRSTIRP